MLYPSKTYKKNTKLGLAGFYETKLEVLLSSFLNNKKKKNRHPGSTSLTVLRQLTAIQMCRQNGARWNNFTITSD